MLACLRKMRYTSLAIVPQYHNEFERYISGLNMLIAQFMISQSFKQHGWRCLLCRSDYKHGKACVTAGLSALCESSPQHINQSFPSPKQKCIRAFTYLISSKLSPTLSNPYIQNLNDFPNIHSSSLFIADMSKEYMIEVRKGWQSARERSWDDYVKHVGTRSPLWHQYAGFSNRNLNKFSVNIEILLKISPDDPRVQAQAYKYLRAITLEVANKDHQRYTELRSYMLKHWENGSDPTPEEAERMWPSEEDALKWEDIAPELQTILREYLDRTTEKDRSDYLRAALHKDSLVRNCVLNPDEDTAIVLEPGKEDIPEGGARAIIAALVNKSFHTRRSLDPDLVQQMIHEHHMTKYGEGEAAQWWYDSLWKSLDSKGKKPDWWPGKDESED